MSGAESVGVAGGEVAGEASVRRETCIEGGRGWAVAAAGNSQKQEELFGVV